MVSPLVESSLHVGTVPKNKTNDLAHLGDIVRFDRHTCREVDHPLDELFCFRKHHATALIAHPMGLHIVTSRKKLEHRYDILLCRNPSC
jgi:hypothetical protein